MKKQKNSSIREVISLIIITFSLFVIMGILVSVFADEHWVYVRCENQYEGGEGSQSQKGDIVDIRPVNLTTAPSEIAKKEWAIIKISGITDENIQELLTPEYTDESKASIKWYRKNKISNLKEIKKGLQLNSRDYKSFLKDKIVTKKQADIAQWRSDKIWFDNTKYWLSWLPSVRIAYATDTNTSTINKLGETYDSLILWEDATDGDLVSDDRIEIAECYDDQDVLPQASTNTLDATTDASRYRKVTVPEGERHNGTISQGFQIELTNHFTSAFYCQENYLIVEYVVIDLNNKSASGIVFLDNGDESVFRKNIVYGSTHTGSKGVSFEDGSTNAEVQNCLFYDLAGLGAYWHTFSVAILRSSTIVDCGTGCGYSGGTPANNRIFNTIVNNSPPDFNLSVNHPLYYCSSSDETADDYSGNDNNVSCTYTFVDKDGDDFHLDNSDDDAKDTGDTILTEDGEDDSRPQGAQDDRGFDEYKAQNPTLTPTITLTPTQTPISQAISEEVTVKKIAPFEVKEGLRFAPYEESSFVNTFGDYEEITIKTDRRYK